MLSITADLVALDFLTIEILYPTFRLAIVWQLNRELTREPSNADVRSQAVYRPTRLDLLITKISSAKFARVGFAQMSGSKGMAKGG